MMSRGIAGSSTSILCKGVIDGKWWNKRFCIDVCHGWSDFIAWTVNHFCGGVRSWFFYIPLCMNLRYNSRLDLLYLLSISHTALGYSQKIELLHLKLFLHVNCPLHVSQFQHHMCSCGVITAKPLHGNRYNRAKKVTLLLLFHVALRLPYSPYRTHGRQFVLMFVSWFLSPPIPGHHRLQ